MKFTKVVKSSKTNIPVKHLEALKNDIIRSVSQAALLNSAGYNLSDSDLQYLEELMNEAADSISSINVRLHMKIKELSK